MAVKSVIITPAVEAVLRRATVNGDNLILPEAEGGGRLDRGLYLDVDKVLKALGGKWNRSSQAHVFAGGFGDQLTAALESGKAIDLKRTLEQFFTPAELAADMCQLVNLGPDDSVLEPSAGDGRIVAAALACGATVDAIEIDSRHQAALLALDNGVGKLSVTIGDFTSIPFNNFLDGPSSRGAHWRPSVVLMNPPFSGGQDVEHFRMAWEALERGGRICAILGEHAFFADDTRSRLFRGFLEEIGGKSDRLPEGTFKAEGTMVRARLVVATKGEA
jgi:predicted RNA methylase